jgi:DNA-binding beta-propeller fold protein YncE
MTLKGAQTMNRMKHAIVATLVLLAASGPAQAQKKHAPAQQQEAPAWPPAPNEPRVKWVAEYRSEFDVGAKKRSGFLERLSGKGQNAQFLRRPLSVAVDDQGTIFIGDFGLGIVAMDPTAHKMIRFADVSQKGLAAPSGVAVDSKFVYATDSNTNQLAVYDKQGHYIQGLNLNDGIKRPVGIAVDETKDLIVVVNGGEHEVLLLNRSLKLQKKVGLRGNRPGQFNYPTFCCIVPGTGFAICDTGNFRIQIFDYNGKYLKSFGQAGDVSGTFARPKGVAVDPDGNLYVVDATFCNFQIFRLDGQVLLPVGQGGAGKGEFQIPAGIAIGKDGAIYVADEMNGRIQRFQYYPEAKKPAGEAATTKP